MDVIIYALSGLSVFLLTGKFLRVKVGFFQKVFLYFEQEANVKFQSSNDKRNPNTQTPAVAYFFPRQNRMRSHRSIVIFLVMSGPVTVLMRFSSSRRSFNRTAIEKRIKESSGSTTW